MRRVRTASIATLGCKLNQSESDEMARQLAEAGVSLVPFGEPVDLCLVNSCTVTHIGDRKSRQLIRQAVRSSPGAFVAVAGCYAELEPEAVGSIDGVDAVLGNRGKDRLVEALREHQLVVGTADPARPVSADLTSPGRADLTPPAPLPGAGMGESAVHGEGRAVASSPFPRGEGGQGVRSSSFPRTRAFLKIQEGCDNRCSYCIVPSARGHQRSRSASEVVREVRRLVDDGYQEVVLTGVNITAYGRDYGNGYSDEKARGMGLVKLLQAILTDTEVPRVRLSSLQPEDLTPRFYDLWGSGRLCRHLHLSLQSGSDAVLNRMRRRYNVDQYARTVSEARVALPGVAITTDVIVGFPGESGAEHQETEAFLRSVGFAGLHVFKYSPRVGTPAAEMREQVDPRVKQQRSDRLIALAAEMGRDFRSQFAGSVLGVLWEEPVPPAEARRLDMAGGETLWIGLSDNYIRVYARSNQDLSGMVSGAQVERLAGQGMAGVLLR